MAEEQQKLTEKDNKEEKEVKKEDFKQEAKETEEKAETKNENNDKENKEVSEPSKENKEADSKIVKGIVGLVLNLMFPGVGTMVIGRIGRGILQLILYIIGLITSIFIVGVFIIMAVWVWAVIDSVVYLVKNNV